MGNRVIAMDAAFAAQRRELVIGRVRAALLVIGFATACQSSPPAPTVPTISPSPLVTPAATVSVEDARAQFVDLVGDVRSSDWFRYRVTDNLDRWISPSEIAWIPEAQKFAAVYFTHSEVDGQFHVQLATSVDLKSWTWRVELADQASQPSITAGADGAYILAWEQEPDPIYNVIVDYASWEDLLAAKPKRRFDVPITQPACGEGTPSIEHVSSDRVDIGFHYHADCVRDLQAAGSTDWTTWEAHQRRPIDHALIELGVEGHIGDRDTITFQGHELMIVEGQRVPDDWSSWRLFLYDQTTDVAEPLDIRTHASSVSLSNATAALVDINDRQAILMSVGIFTEGSHADEDGGLIYYRYL